MGRARRERERRAVELAAKPVRLDLGGGYYFDTHFGDAETNLAYLQMGEALMNGYPVDPADALKVAASINDFSGDRWVGPDGELPDGWAATCETKSCMRCGKPVRTVHPRGWPLHPTCAATSTENTNTKGN